MWNGQVLLHARGEIAAACSAALSETDFASFIAWRDWGFPDKSVRNCFPMAALRSVRWALSARRHGRHTATAGKSTFAAARPTRTTSIGDTVDLERGVIRELTEETGLGLADVAPEPAGLRRRSASARADEDRAGGESAPRCASASARFLAHKAAGARGHSLRAQPRDLEPSMPPYVAAFLAAAA
jgi:hypothetical protein